MTQRERFVRLMTFQSVDRIPLMEMGVWPETLRRWHGEGLPGGVTNLRQLEEHLRLDISFNLNWLPLDQEFLPAFEEKVLEDHGTDEVVQDNRGTILRRRKELASIPHYIRFPVETEADYEKLLPRLNGADPARYPAGFDEDLRRRRERGEIIGLNFRAFSWGWRT
jgi:uroporphyrinogen decarboxylase